MYRIKKSGSIWNLLRNFRKEQKDMPKGQEIRGVVVQHGVNEKTVTVRSFWKTYNTKF